ncbi:MAG: hypothetical protein ABI651_12660, partial [Verrucomicrobiota bacterium]
MKFSRLTHDPAALIELFEQGLTVLGAVHERPWHDRLQLIAEGPSAKLWNSDGTFVETELHFSPADTTGPREADKEVFPGCPLTFRLAEALRHSPMPLERIVLRPLDSGNVPAPESAEKVWHQQFAGSSRWHMEGPFKAAWHFSLLSLVRCEIQAIDQHWSLHRLVLSLPQGEQDESLSAAFDFAQVDPDPQNPLDWPSIEHSHLRPLLQSALEQDLAENLASIRLRQQNYLHRELERIDDYFEAYERELLDRQSRSQSESTKMKTNERLAAARAEHQRRRQDQVQRHEIRLIPHLD